MQVLHIVNFCCTIMLLKMKSLKLADQMKLYNDLIKLVVIFGKLN